MARRRLEAAIQAGKAIEEGREVTSVFTRVEKCHTHELEEVYDGVYSLQFSYDGEYLAVGYGDSGIDILNTTSGRVVGEIQKHRYGATPITCIRFNPKNQNTLLATSSSGNVYSANIHDYTCQVAVEEVKNEINCLDFNVLGSNFATGGKDLNVRIYDTATNELLKTFEGYHVMSPNQSMMGHATRIFALKYHPDHNEIFITAGWDNHLKVWDVRTKEGVNRTIPGPHICGDSMDIRGNEILTGSWTQSDALQLWNFSEGELIKNIPFNEGEKGAYLYAAQFCENDVVLAGGSGTKSVQAINIKTSQVLGEIKLEKAVQAMDSTNGGRKFAFGGVGTHMIMANML